jgi:hypothetical protein
VLVLFSTSIDFYFAREFSVPLVSCLPAVQRKEKFPRKSFNSPLLAFLSKNNERTKEEVYGSARATSPQFAIYIPPLPFVFQTKKKK